MVSPGSLTRGSPPVTGATHTAGPAPARGGDTLTPWVLQGLDVDGGGDVGGVVLGPGGDVLYEGGEGVGGDQYQIKIKIISI